MPLKTYRIFAGVKPGTIKAWDSEYDGQPQPLATTVYETEEEWQDTGLVDLDGNPIKSFRGKDQIGFLWFDEEGKLPAASRLQPSAWPSHTCRTYGSGVRLLCSQRGGSHAESRSWPDSLGAGLGYHE